MQSRRHFLRTTAAATLAASAACAQTRPNQQLRVGIMGLSRGRAHIENYSKLAGVEIAYVCDVDQKRLAEGVKLATELQGGKAPTKVFRGMKAKI